MLILGDLIASALLYDIGLGVLLPVALMLIVPLVYFYILYKRYHVEVVPESDVVLFEDPEDLMILCNIYGLDNSGELEVLRQRLLEFVRTNKDNAFTWVAPKAVLSLGSALEIEGVGGSAGRGKPTPTNHLPGGRTRSTSRLSSIDRCPVCDSPAPKKGTTCKKCGADLEFYVAFGESKLGKLVLSEKSGFVRRKIRYEEPPSRED